MGAILHRDTAPAVVDNSVIHSIVCLRADGSERRAVCKVTEPCAVCSDAVTLPLYCGHLL